MLTREQNYAIDVLGRVQAVATGDKKEYKAMAQEMPVLVRSAGLVQALTFLQSRSSNAHKQLLEDLARTVNYANGAALVEASRNAPMPQYIRLTEQILDALQWYKRLVQVDA